jgi:hypothetical protein
VKATHLWPTYIRAPASTLLFSGTLPISGTNDRKYGAMLFQPHQSDRLRKLQGDVQRAKSDPRVRTTKPANRRELSSSQVVVRFALRLALLSTFAVGHAGYAGTLAGFLLLSAVCCAAVGAARREAVFGPVLTHWDEAAVYGLVGCAAAAFA